MFDLLHEVLFHKALILNMNNYLFICNVLLEK